MSGAQLQPYAAPSALSAQNAAVVSSISISGETHDLLCAGDYVYAGGDSGLFIYDVQNPASMTLVGSVTISTTDASIDLSGRYIVFVANSTNTLTVVDISNAAAPSIAGSITDATNLNGSRGVRVAGKYAYVSCTSNRLTVVDISNAASPVVASSTVDATHLVGAGDIDVLGRYAYLALSSGLAVWDISNPASPSYAGSVASVALNRIRAQGRYVYGITAGGSTLTVFDVSNPASPTQAAQISDASINLSLRLAVSGGLCCIPTQQDPTTFSLVDISKPTAPQVIKPMYSGTAFGDHNFAAAFAGRYLFTANYYLTCTDLVGVTGQDAARNIDALSTGTLRVRRRADIDGDLRVSSSMSVGPRGLRSGGPISGGDIVQTGYGATGSRPSAAAAGPGAAWFDTTLVKPIWSDGSVWRDATGTAV